LATLLEKMDVRMRRCLEAPKQTVSAPVPLTREEIQLGKRREMRAERIQRRDGIRDSGS
jgi:hypothetical protein